MVDPARELGLDQSLVAELRTLFSGHLCIYTAGFEPGTIADLIVTDKVDGYLLKGSGDGERLRHNLYAVGRYGDLTVDRAIVVDARVRLVGRVSIIRPEAAPPLTDRERVILHHLALGRPHEDMARLEGLSGRTVERVIGTLKEKFEADNPNVVAVRACKLGLV